MIVEGTYRLLAGSYIRKDHVNRFASHNYAKLRRQLEEESFFESSESENYFKLTEIGAICIEQTKRDTTQCL